MSTTMPESVNAEDEHSDTDTEADDVSEVDTAVDDEARLFPLSFEARDKPMNDNSIIM